MDNGMTVLVTGSSRGIGKTIAKEFLLNGFKTVINCSKSVDEMNKTLKELENINDNVIGIKADVSKYDEAKLMIDEIMYKWGKIDILINNAGISYIGLFNEMNPEEWKNIMDINLNSVFNCTRLVISDMIKEKKGTIVNISSIWGNIGASCEAVYSASKGAVNSFTKAMAKELGPCNIKINAIACGVIDTGMNSFLSNNEKETLINEIPLMRYGKTEEVAKLAVFLSSEDSNYLTGQVITIDGALT